MVEMKNVYPGRATVYLSKLSKDSDHQLCIGIEHEKGSVNQYHISHESFLDFVKTYYAKELEIEKIKNTSVIYKRVLEHRKTCEKWGEGFCLDCFGGGLILYSKSIKQELCDSILDRDLIAEFQHKLWCRWSKDIVTTEHLSHRRIIRWTDIWKTSDEKGWIHLHKNLKFYDFQIADALIEKLKSNKKVGCLDNTSDKVSGSIPERINKVGSNPTPAKKIKKIILSKKARNDFRKMYGIEHEGDIREVNLGGKN